MKNEDVIFSSAVQIIDDLTPVEDINRCLELIRFPHMSGGWFPIKCHTQTCTDERTTTREICTRGTPHSSNQVQMLSLKECGDGAFSI